VSPARGRTKLHGTRGTVLLKAKNVYVVAIIVITLWSFAIVVTVIHIFGAINLMI
jgi:hypothetical protein